ncbi:hypothetical protein DEM27_09225 [Metarhizobium album]|uniref:Uncharacterized protein n=1 Tax=Metarhizobium album TaxID=2182425 RepID=A0A2U2DU30_9HYPH|nr:hypothetical protein DEM27_09225 [Rhizobium album]
MSIFVEFNIASRNGGAICAAQINIWVQ